MENSPYFDIFLLAIFAGIIGFRLYMVLGRRTGNERSPEDRVAGQLARAPDSPRNPVLNPVPARAPVSPLEAPVPDSAAASGLLDIKLSDRRFDTAKFLVGARAAYEKIVTDFAHGDRESLRALVSEEVFHTFEGVIAQREARNERVDFTFQGIRTARIRNAKLEQDMAEITVAFDAAFLLAAYNPAGELVEGDPKTPHTVTDVWTFSRNVGASDPNWELIATATG